MKPRRERLGPALAARLRDPRLLFGVLSLALVSWLTLADLGRTSPGPLTSVHGQVAELDGGSACDACHGGGGLLRADRSLDAACGDCHEAILADVDGGTGLHGQLATPRDCGACHVEHHGDELALVGPAAFLAAGVPEVERFDHAMLDFALEGRHAELQCEACHPNAHVLVLPEGERRFHGLAQACESCHDDPHGGRMVPACADCHGQALPFEEVATFAHREFELDGAHAAAACVDCHEPGGGRSVEALASLRAGDPRAPAPRDCASCHDDPHARGFAAGVAASLGVASGASCEACHAATLAAFEPLEAATTPALHAAGGWPLDGAHAEVDCASCHAGDTFAERYAPGGAPRAADACEACHADPHDAQFLAEVAGPAARGPLACAECHTTAGFAPSTFEADDHAATGFALEASHAEAACAECHLAPPGDAPTERVALAVGLVDRTASVREITRFRGLEDDCAACHLDAHAERTLVARGPDPFQGCEQCHVPTRFDDELEAGFDHGRDARFALAGAHAEADCAVCHPPAATPDATGRTFGSVAAHFGTPVDACATCHVDPHVLAGGGAFPVEASAAERAEGCALCHAEDAFAAVAGGSFPFGARGDFPHGPRAGFELEGAHARTACEACHVEPAPAVESAGARVATPRTLGFVAHVEGLDPAACATCHVDPHGDGLVGAAASRDCARCHTAEAFAPHVAAGFDHARDTGQSLGGAHAGVACEACHTPLPEVDARGRTFARAAGTRCIDCHADPHLGQFALEGRTDCARCHPSDGTAARFDHQRDARFALDERHAALDCAACHVRATLRDGRETVRYKPLGTACADCHGTRGGVR